VRPAQPPHTYRRLTRRAASASALFLLLGCGGQPRAAAPHSDIETLNTVDALVAETVEAQRLPGLSFAVLLGDSVWLARGYGRTAVDEPARVTPETVFQLGSISKSFLAALVVALAGDGAIALDDPARRYLPDFPHLPASLRIRHLLNHSSGTRELFMLPEAEDGFSNLDRTVADLRAAVRRAPLDFDPGTRWSYSNTNYTLLSFIVEQVTGTPYHEALATRFFEPLELRSLRHCPPEPGGPGAARGHVVAGGTLAAARPENTSWAWGDGGLCGTALDVARWMRALASGRALGPLAYETMIAPATLADGRQADYGFGLSLAEPDGVRKVAHNGAMLGFSGSAAHYPDTRVTVVVLTNRGDVRTESIERAIARRLLGLPEPDIRRVAVPDDERARVAGTYDIGVFDVHVVERGDQLWIEMPLPGPTTRLLYLDAGEFAGESDPDAYRLRFDDGQPARELRLLMGAMHWYGVRR
jgi:D-alanyl-D-alanine carboxypeptidase